MFGMRGALLVCVALAILVAGACNRDKGDEPIRDQHREGLEKSTQATASQPLVQGVNLENKGFASWPDRQPVAPEVRTLDKLIRPVLQAQFGGVKLIAESTGPETRLDGEVIENSFSYAVSRVFVPDDGRALHKALVEEAKFGLSPRLGKKPTVWTGGATMSFLKVSGGRTYSMVITLDVSKQQIRVESYRPGSKYDRMG